MCENERVVFNLKDECWTDCIKRFIRLLCQLADVHKVFSFILRPQDNTTSCHYHNKLIRCNMFVLFYLDYVSLRLRLSM